MNTGIFGFSLELATTILLITTIVYFPANRIIKSLPFVLFNTHSFNVFKYQLNQTEKQRNSLLSSSKLFIITIA